MDTQLEFAKEALERCDERGTKIALEECIKRIERQHEELRRVAEFANCMAKPVQYEDDTVYLQHLKSAHIFYSGLAKRSPDFKGIQEESVIRSSVFKEAECICRANLCAVCANSMLVASGGAK